MKLSQLTPPEYLGCSMAQAIYNNTWGHFSPHKNTSYKGIVRFALTDHSEYGSQPIIITYDFQNLSGPYIHNVLFKDVHNWNKNEQLKPGVIYEIKLTFRNYRFYYGKIRQLIK